MSSSGEILTAESFLFICKEIGLSFNELEMMDIGQCLDYIQQWIDEKSGKEKASNETTRQANQNDFDRF